MKRIKNIQDTGATDERAAATTAVEEHTAAMAARASTQEALRVAREYAIAQRANTCGMIIPRDSIKNSLCGCGLCVYLIECG